MPRIDVRSIRRDQILDAAERLVAQRGWEKTSFADICREADVSNGVLTYHFADKDDLFLSLFERVAGRWRDRLEGEFCTGSGPAAERIEILFREAAETMERDRPLYLLLLRYLSEAPDKPEIAERLGRLFGEMRERVGRTLADEVGVADPATGAGVLQTVILGYVLGRAALGWRVSPEDVATMLTGHLVGGDSIPPPAIEPV